MPLSPQRSQDGLTLFSAGRAFSIDLSSESPKGLVPNSPASVHTDPVITNPTAGKQNELDRCRRVW